MSVCDACSTVVAGINCVTRVAKSCGLCTITSLFLLINFRQTIYFARPQIPSTTHFSWDEAKYFHEIMPLTFWVILSLWYMNYDCMMTQCPLEILVTKLHSAMILVVLHMYITRLVTHVTQHSVTCVTLFYLMFYVFIYFCWSFIC